MNTRSLLRQLPYFPWHSLLVVWLPFLHFHQQNFHILGPWDGAGLVAVYSLGVVLLLGLGRLVWGSLALAGLVVTPLVGVMVKGWAMGVWPSLALLTVALGLGVFLFFGGRGMARLGLPVNLAVLVLVAFPLIQLVSVTSEDPQVRPAPRFWVDPPIPSAAANASLPDVYYLLVDGLGQPAYLQQAYGLPSRRLSQGLENLGFRVLQNSRANYPQTALSAAATMNMAHIPEILDIDNPLSRDRRPLATVVGQNRVARAFAGLGYQTVSFPSGYPLTRLDPVDRRVEPGLNPSFAAYYILRQGFLPLVQPLFGKGPAFVSFALRRHRLNFTFQHLGQVRQGMEPQTPVFVFAHILAPHPPFVFDSKGNALPSQAPFTFGDGNDWHRVHNPPEVTYERLWTGQSLYVLRRLEEAVREIQAQSPRPPVIIIQGDHGPGTHTNWDSVRGTNHAERFGIFNAWLLPADLPVALRDDQTAINTFPLLLNALTGSHLPLQADRHWFARMREPYRFYEVTD